MVDTVDSKSAARKGVRVQVPPGVLKGTSRKICSLFLCFFRHNSWCIVEEEGVFVLALFRSRSRSRFRFERER